MLNLMSVTAPVTAPWWGAPLIGAVSALVVLLGSALIQTLRERTQRSHESGQKARERLIHWDDKRLDLCVDIMTALYELSDDEHAVNGLALSNELDPAPESGSTEGASKEAVNFAIPFRKVADGLIERRSRALLLSSTELIAKLDELCGLYYDQMLLVINLVVAKEAAEDVKPALDASGKGISRILVSRKELLELMRKDIGN